MKKILTEPLAHFLLVGFIVFGAYAVLNPGEMNLFGKRDEDLQQTIVMDRASYTKLQNLIAAAESDNNETNSDSAEIFIDEWLEDAVLLEEALQRGLHLNDQQIATRLRQKVRMSILSGLPTGKVIPDEEVNIYIESNRESLLLPSAFSFVQMYFGKELTPEDTQTITELFVKHGDSTEDELRASLQDYLVSHRLPYVHRLRDAKAIDQIFGQGFSESIKQLEVGLWSGPIESGFGWHWLQKTEVQPEQLPEEKVLYAQVRQRLTSMQSEEDYQRALGEIKKRYKVAFPEFKKTE